jgi:hypothetical protein
MRHGSKRSRSPETDREDAMLERMVESMIYPTPYLGTTIEEHRDFVCSCIVVFRLNPSIYATDARKVLYASHFLRGVPLTRWATHEKTIGEDTSTWTEFIDFLRDLIQDPHNRISNIWQKLGNAWQQDDQTLQSFVTYLQSLEAGLPPCTEAFRKGSLLARMKPSIHNEIMWLEKHPDTLEGLISAAACIDENQRKIRHILSPRPAGNIDFEERTKPLIGSSEQESIAGASKRGSGHGNPTRGGSPRTKGCYRGRGRGGFALLSRKQPNCTNQHIKKPRRPRKHRRGLEGRDR